MMKDDRVPRTPGMRSSAFSAKSLKLARSGDQHMQQEIHVAGHGIAGDTSGRARIAASNASTVFSE